MTKDGSSASRVSAVRSRFIRKSAKPGSKRRPKTILILGAKNIGKTCLAKRYLNGDFNEHYVSTVEERYAADITYKGYKINVEIVDIDAFEFPAMRDLCVKEASLLMLVYEIGNKKSFEVLKKIYDITRSVCDYPLPTIIVGTKADKLESKLMVDGKTDDYVEEFVQELNSNVHTDIAQSIITSSKIGFHVNQAFNLGLEDIVKTINTASLAENSHLDTQNNGCCTIL
eukprot:gene9088-10057_t